MAKKVTFVEDPFGLKTLEIAQAQQNTEELDLEEPGLPNLPATSEESSSIDEQSAPDENPETELDLQEIQSCMEAVLFMSDKPISLSKLREMLGPDFKLSIFQDAITELCDRYKSAAHGIELVKVAGSYQFRTKPGRAELARKLARVQTQRLSSGAMETLAIVAYQQPVMKEQVDKIRGVDSSHFIRGLLEKKFIRISGRSELPGRPLIYSTDERFLEVFGLPDLNALPPLREIEQMIPASQVGGDPEVQGLRDMVNQMKSDQSDAIAYDAREDDVLLKSIKERVNSIPVSTPFLEEQRALENAEKALIPQIPNNPEHPVQNVPAMAERGLHEVT